MIKEKVMTKAETKTVQFTKADKIKFSILVSTILTVAEPTGTNTITLPDRSGSVVTTGDTNGSASISGNMFKSKITLSILDSSGATLTTMYAPGSNT